MLRQFELEQRVRLPAAGGPSCSASAVRASAPRWKTDDAPNFGRSRSATTATKRLLLDHRAVLSSESARLVPGEAVKHPLNPLLSDANEEQMRPWEVRYDNMQARPRPPSGTLQLPPPPGPRARLRLLPH